jgi:maltose alpha-D-glucosyltransferase/alpha-amylase
LLCEANQWPEDVRPYFGDGDEFHVGFHFPVMPRIFMALRKEDKTPLVWIVDRTPPIPAECQWVIFLRNHDELTLEMVTEEERQWMWQEYAPEPRMRLNLGIRRRLAPLLDNDRRKIELANSLLLTSPGSPIIYYGDEIGMGDDIYLPDRNGVRTPMQWNNELNAGFSTAPADALYAPMIQLEPYGAQWVNVADQRADPNSLWHRLRRMISVRKAHPAFGWGDFSWAETGSPAVAAYWRVYGDEQLLILNNLSQQVQSLTIDLAPGKEIKFSDILTGNETLLTIKGKLELTLKPFEYRWLKRSN